jgi:hypothetical protein
MTNVKKQDRYFFALYCIYFHLNIVFFLISLIMDGKLLHELGTSLDCSSNADLLASSKMHPWELLPYIGTKYRCCRSCRGSCKVLLELSETLHVLGFPFTPAPLSLLLILHLLRKPDHCQRSVKEERTFL